MRPASAESTGCKIRRVVAMSGIVAVKGLLLRPATDLTIELSVHRNVSGSAAAISGIGIAGGVFVWARTCGARRWLRVRVFGHLPRSGRREDFCVRAPALLQLATSTGTS
jgi:hypothetical protein